MELKIDSIDMLDGAFEPLKHKLSKTVEEAIQLHIDREKLPRYMNKKEACQYLNCSFQTLQNFERRGLKVILIGGLARIDKEDCDSFMQQNKR